MRRYFLLAIAIGSLFCRSIVADEGGATAPASSELRAALDELDGWLGSGDNGRAWRRFLHTSELRAELSRGRTADRGALGRVLGRYEAGAAGADGARFARVRKALGAEIATGLPQADLVALLEAARGQYAAPAADLQSAKARVVEVLARLDAYLAPGGANGAAWRAYLRSDDLAAQLRAEAPDARVLYEIRDLYLADQTGLDLPVFANVGSALAKYAGLAEAALPATAAEMDKQWAYLATALPQYAQQPNEETAYEIGTRVGWLARLGQAPAFVQAVRERHGLPNLYVQASSGFVAAGLGRPIDDVAPVTDYILGTSISGTGHTVGRTQPRLIPASRRAVIENRLIATVHTKTVGYNGPAIIYADGQTELDGRIRLIVEDQAVKAEPATACATTSTCITGIDSSKSGVMGNIVVKVATRRADKQKGQAEWIAARHAEDRLRGRMNGQVKTELARAEREMNARNPLLRRRRAAGVVSFATSDDFLHITSLQRDADQLGAATSPPAAPATGDLLVQLHETAANNWASAMLSGVTLKEEDVQAKVIELRGSLPDQLKSDEERGPWSLTFANVRPVSLSFGDGGFKVTIRGKRFTSADRQFRAMNISATYKLHIDGGRTKLVRQGELEIFPPGFAEGQTLSTQQITLKTLLQKKFGKLLEPEILTEGLELPGDWKKVGKLSISHLQSEAGWLVLGWVRPAATADKMASNER